jgi:hypothetical protein
MKPLSFGLCACLGLGAIANSQTPAQPSAQKTPQAAAQTLAHDSAPSSSGSQSIGRACKKEIKQLCGRRAHGEEKQDCIKANLDLNKFSADCKTKLSMAAKPSG